MQWVLVCYSVLQCAAVCCSVLQCAVVCCNVLHCVAVFCSMLQCAAVSCIPPKKFATFCHEGYVNEFRCVFIAQMKMAKCIGIYYI